MEEGGKTSAAQTTMIAREKLDTLNKIKFLIFF